MATKDPWIISMVEVFARDFPIGTRLSAKDLGKWMIDHKGIEEPFSTKPNDPTWIKYIRDRNALRAQFNRYASSKTFAATSMSNPFEIHHIKGDEYQVLAIHDDIRKLMRDLIGRTKIGFGIKSRKIGRLHDIAEAQALPFPEVLRLDRLKEDLNDTREDVVRILNKAIRLMDRCDQDFETMSKKGITNGNSTPDNTDDDDAEE